MDPISAFGLAVNIIALVDFVGRVISYSSDAYKSSDGKIPENSELRNVTERLRQLNKDVDQRIKTRREDGSELSESEYKQEQLGLQCQSVAAELIQVLDTIQGQGSQTRWSSARQAILTIWNKEKIENLEKRLDRFRQELVTTTLASLR
jgi:hypothetical protein